MRQNSFLDRKASHSGSAIVIAILFVLLLTGAVLGFLSHSTRSIHTSRSGYDSADAEFRAESANKQATNLIMQAVNGIILQGRMPVINPNLASETAFAIVPAYNGNEFQFLHDIVESEAVNGSGTLVTSNKFSNFATAFPSTWTDPNVSAGNNFQVQYTFTPLPLVQNTSPITQYVFQYEYRVQVRSYGSNEYTSAGSDDAGVITVTLQGAPFSQWSIFRSTTSNPAASLLYFAGGDTSAQDQEVFYGPIQTVENPNFVGHPNFYSVVTSAAPQSGWNEIDISGYSGAPNFAGGTASGSAYNISMPTQIFNTTRLAAGDTGPNPATNNNAVTNANLVSWLGSYAGGGSTGANGTLSSSLTSVPTGIYVPVNNLTSNVPTGGIYVQGDAAITLGVAQGSSAFPANEWANIQAQDQSCSFQKVNIVSTTSGIKPRDIYIGTTPCTDSYVFDATPSSSTYTIVNGQLNGNIQVAGAITGLGSATRTSPAIATDVSMTIAASGQISITNDLQYQDATYVAMNSSGGLGTTEVATPTGTVGSSGYTPTSDGIAPQISSTSQTVLGIVSTAGSVLIAGSTPPANLNIHAAIYAGDSAAASGGAGCGSGSYAGCGFGVQAYATATNLGTLKMLGSISEYRSQSTGVLTSPPTGYTRNYIYDTRFRQDLTPPGFPISNQLQAYPTISPYKTWRLTQNN